MAKKAGNIFAVMMLIVLGMPTLAHLEHHHENNDYRVGSKDVPAWFREHCAICNLEFSIFLVEEKVTSAVTSEFASYYFNPYSTVFYQNTSCFSFNLRAPPDFTNS